MLLILKLNFMNENLRQKQANINESNEYNC
jgi:hypothetical protein